MELARTELVDQTRKTAWVWLIYEAMPPPRGRKPGHACKVIRNMRGRWFGPGDRGEALPEFCST